MATTTELERVLDRLFSALERGDVDAAMRDAESVAAPDVHFTSLVGTAVEGRVYTGFDEVRDWFTDLTESFEVNYEDRSFREGRDGSVVFLAQMKLRGRGSDARLEQGMATVFETDAEGKVFRAVTYASQDEALRAAGVADA